jgi:hypothetical protein
MMSVVKPAKALAALGLALVSMLLLAATAGAWSLGGGELSEPLNTSWSGTITVRDGGLEVGGKDVAVTCEDSVQAVVESEGGGQVNKWAISKCTAGSGEQLCTGAESLEAMNLPWSMATSRGILELRGNPTTGKLPELAIRCQTVLGEYKDTCASNTFYFKASNQPGGVQAELENHELSCNYGGAQHNRVETSQLMVASNGGQLMLFGGSMTEEAEWHMGGTRLSGSAASHWTGAIALTDALGGGGKGRIAAECNSSATGTVEAEPRGYGTVAAWEASKCVAGAENQLCLSGESLTAVNLPWKTKLVNIEGKVRQVIVGGGKGNPGFTVHCSSALGEKTEDTCVATGGPLILGATNTAEGVDVAEKPSEHLKCKEGGENAGSLSGSQTMTTTGGLLEAVPS